MKLLMNIIAISVFALGFSTSAFALDLKTARAQKLVIEKPDGFVEAKDPKAKELAESVNAKRKSAYEKVAKKTKTSVEVVGAQAHKKIMKNLGK